MRGLGEKKRHCLLDMDIHSSKGSMKVGNFQNPGFHKKVNLKFDRERTDLSQRFIRILKTPERYLL